MNNFFDEKTLENIKKNETGANKINDFISIDEIKEVTNYLRNLKNKSIGKNQTINREESTKIFFDFNQTELLKKIKKRIEDIMGEFYVNDFQPHMITCRYPLRLHVDTGKNPKDSIYKNIVIPVEITHENDFQFSKILPNTIVFKNKWYDQSALFTTKSNNNYDFIIKDINNKFVDIINIHDFKKQIDKVNNIQFSYTNTKFFVNDDFKRYIKTLSETKRYNLRTDKHIVNTKPFNKEHYEKYLTHQPYEDCQSLEIDKVLSWDVGSLLHFDRTRIHSADNFLKNNVTSKTCIALFTSKTKN